MTGSVVKVEGVTKRFAGHTAVEAFRWRSPRGHFRPARAQRGREKHHHPDDHGHHRARRGPGGARSAAPQGRDLSARIGFLPEERGLYKKMKVLDHLDLPGRDQGDAAPARAKRAG